MVGRENDPALMPARPADYSDWEVGGFLLDERAAIASVRSHSRRTARSSCRRSARRWSARVAAVPKVAAGPQCSQVNGRDSATRPF